PTPPGARPDRRALGRPVRGSRVRPLETPGNRRPREMTVTLGHTLGGQDPAYRSSLARFFDVQLTSTSAPLGDPRSNEAEKHASDDDDDCESRSEEHTSELQSRFDLVCRLLLEK